MKKVLPFILIFVFALLACKWSEPPIDNSLVTQTIPAITSTISLAGPSSSIATSTPTLEQTKTPYVTPIIAVTVLPPATIAPPLHPGHPIELTSLHMINSKDGWGIDSNGYILHTSNAGLGWQNVTPPKAVFKDQGFFALDTNTAWATAGCDENCSADLQSVILWRTTDGGITWVDFSICLNGKCGFLPDTTAEYFIPKSLQFLDTKTGWLLASVNQLMFQDRYRLYKTTDGGASWTYVSDNGNGPLAVSATGAVFLNEKLGWFGVNQVGGPMSPAPSWFINKTTDGGVTWNGVDLPEPTPLPDIFKKFPYWCGAKKISAIPPKGIDLMFTCVVYDKDKQPSYSFHFHSSDAGQSWQSWPETGGSDFISESVGWRLSAKDNGNFSLEKTLDGGSHWAQVKTVQWSGSLDFVDQRVGWALATNGTVTTLVHTTNGGQSWEEIKPIITNQ
jgi:photosystem II stability/assembly factor-like uncharacterized protein